MPVTAGPIYPGIKDGLVFAIDPANKDSWTGPTSDTVNSLTLYNPISGDIINDTSGSYGDNESFAFDGIDDKINLGSSVSLNGNFTVSLWYKNTSGGTPSGYRNFIGGGGAFQYGLTMNGGVWKTYTAGSPTWEPMSNSVIDGNWHNLTVINDNGNTNWTSYQNGQFFKTITRDYPSNSFGRIGSYSTGTVRFILGNIGIILAYNRILSAGEILQNYNRLKGRFGLS